MGPPLSLMWRKILLSVFSMCIHKALHISLRYFCSITFINWILNYETCQTSLKDILYENNNHLSAYISSYIFEGVLYVPLDMPSKLSHIVMTLWNICLFLHPKLKLTLDFFFLGVGGGGGDFSFHFFFFFF